MVLQGMNTSLLQLSVFLEQKQKKNIENLQNVGMNKEVFGSKLGRLLHLVQQ